MDSVIKGLIIGIISGVVAGLLILLWALIQPQKNCPQCGKPFPKFRKPKTRRQRLWGGWTCPNCGCEVDRKGRKIRE